MDASVVGPQSGLYKHLRVFVASPGDVAVEREALAKVVGELNVVLQTLVPEKGIHLDLLRWETHVYPAMGRPQEVINNQIQDYDIFIGIMWKKFGTPTGEAESGTEEELNIAFNNWSRFKRPHILFYFCQAPFPPPRTEAEAEQLVKVVRFREKLSKEGLLWEYDKSSSFADAVRAHLIAVVARMAGSSFRELEAAPQPSPDQARSMHLRVSELAREYQDLRNRLPRSDERTRQMEIIFTRMRSEAQGAYPLLKELTLSGIPGERLVAVAMLDVQPHPEYLQWLCQRFYPGAEQEFVQYQAAQALRSAGRILECEHLPTVEKWLSESNKLLKDLPTTTDRRRTLIDAAREVQERRKRC
jgi:hypothetical protein